MTYKSTIISLAAATAIAAMVSGCGSSDSTPIIPAASTGGIQSSVQAVDGYIYNGKVEAYYLAEDNTTMKPVTLEAAKTTKDVADGTIKVGSATYKLPADTNDSVKKALRFFKISKAASSSSGTIFTPETYIEADGIDGYDVNDTLLGSNVIYAPATSKVLSPVSSLAYLAAKAMLGSETTAPTTTVELNATTIAQIESNATAIAKNLGLGDVDILTADPVALAEKNPTYKLVSGLLLNANATDAAAILAATPATSLAETLQVVAKATSAAKGAALAAGLAQEAATGAFTTDTIAKMNIEKSVEKNQYIAQKPAELKGTFPISDINVNSKDIADLVASGAKIKGSTLNVAVAMPNVKSDANISNSKFKLFVAIEGTKAYVADTDTNETGGIAFEVPFDMNLTSGTVATAGIPAATMIKFEAKSSNGDTIITKEYNASTIDKVASSSIKDNGAISITGSTTLSIDVEKLTTAIAKVADGNLTGATGLNLSNISNVKIALVDADGKTLGLSDDNVSEFPLPKTAFSSYTGGISASDAIKIVDLGNIDFRGAGYTGANKAPQIVKLDGNNTGATVTIGYANAAKTTNSAFHVDLNTSIDNFENNTTIEVSKLPSWVTVTKSKHIADTNNSRVDFNLTIDRNLTIGDTNVTAFFKATDEFGKANAVDGNLSFFFNAPAKVTVNSASSSLVTNWKQVDKFHYTADINSSEVNNTIIKLDVINMMGESNTSVTDSNSTGVLVATGSVPFELNSTTGKGTISLIDINASTTGTTDLNVTIPDSKTNTNKIYIDFNTSV